MKQQLSFFDDPYLTVPNMLIKDTTKRAIELLRANEPDDGYYLAFSGGKDSCVCRKLLELSGCQFDAWYNNTTIDPPELIRFIKDNHSDVGWNNSKYGNMMHRVATAPKTPPTRHGRWCCEEYKEYGGVNRVRVFGVRRAESPARKARWSELSYGNRGSLPVICPVAFWTDEQVWEFIHYYGLPYCSLYDDGFDRLGCVGCPLQSKNKQDIQFARYPRYEANWRHAIITNWQNWKDVPNSKTGRPRYQAKFKTGEDFWQWWRSERAPDYIRGFCQSELLWTNEPGIIYDDE